MITKAKKKASDITGAQIVTINPKGSSVPALRFAGDAPEIGATITAKLDNGVSYTGTVAAVTEAGGFVVAELIDGLTPLT